LKTLDLSENISKQKLLNVLKSEADKVHVIDIMFACSHLKEESKYVQASYRKEYDQIYIESFLLGIKKIREDNNYYPGFVDTRELKKAFKTLKSQETRVKIDYPQHLRFFRIYKLITIYTTFVRDEPVHPVGMPFPGGFKIKYENGTYYCPVKENQKDNPGAVCGICIAEQDKDV
jgi:uncharacterized protein (UPF0305 family)